MNVKKKPEKLNTSKIHQIMTLGHDTNSSKEDSPLVKLIYQEQEPKPDKKKKKGKGLSNRNEFFNVCSTEFITKEEIEENEKILKSR